MLSHGVMNRVKINATMMKRLLYILSLVTLALACTPELIDTGIDGTDLKGKVMIDFSVQLPGAVPSTKALAEKPTLKNLMVAVFDAEGYLVEHAFASVGTQYATENSTQYIYKVVLTQSKERRIIHFIGNAPASLRFGTEETVLSYIKSELNSENEDLYWYRREVPSISGTNQTVEPIYQATSETRAAFDNIPLIRNFARISLINAAESDFELESWTVVNTYKTGTCAAYNTSNGTFVDYFNYVDSTDPTLQQLGIKELGPVKTLESLMIMENYKGNVPANAEKVSIEEAKASLEEAKTSLQNEIPYFYYAFERDVTSDPAYIIAYGTYKGDGKNNKCYYKIGFYDNDGKSFPLLRNFQYTITITKIERAGYQTFEEASASTGSGNISTAQETMSLVYISDGDASLSVEYIERMLVSANEVDLRFEFISDVGEGTVGSLDNVRVVVNKPEGTAGAAIAKINGAEYTVGQAIKPTNWTLKVTPVTPTSVSKKQSLTIFADYKKGDDTFTLQRTVTYITWEKQNISVECNPSEIPQERGSEFDLKITLPGGLSSSMFPLNLKIEAANLSITPNNAKDYMPAQSGNSNIPGKEAKSAFYFIKTVQWSEYRDNKVVTCHFKSNKDVSDTQIWVANEYFNPSHDMLTTYQASHFNELKFNPNLVACGEDTPVEFSFKMDGELVPVTVYLGGLKPSEDDTNNLVSTGQVVDGKALYTFTPTTASVTLKLQTISANSRLYVDLEAYHYLPASDDVGRNWNSFRNSSINYNQAVLEGAGRPITIRFTKDTGDTEFNTRTITVKLNGMKAGDAGISITGGEYVEAIIGGFTVRPTNDNVTITGIVTTFRNETEGKLSVTLDEPTYEPVTLEAERTKSTFEGEFDGTLNGEAGQEIDYTFTIDDGYTADMVVNVEFDGLEFANQPNNQWTDKGNGKWEYRPTTSGETRITLKTTESGTRTNSVTLSAAGFNTLSSEIWQGLSINNKTIKFTFEIDHNKINQYVTSLTGITSDDSKTQISYGAFTSNRNDDNQPYTIEATISGLTINNAKETTKITFTIRCRRNDNYDYTFSYTAAMSDLIKLFNANDVPSIYLGKK